MKKGIVILALTALLAGCAGMIDVLDVLSPDPVPVCDKDSAGSVYKGQACLKYTDGTYRWTKIGGSDGPVKRHY